MFGDLLGKQGRRWMKLSLLCSAKAFRTSQHGIDWREPKWRLSFFAFVLAFGQSLAFVLMSERGRLLVVY